MRRRRWDWVDWLLVLSWLPAGLIATTALLSIPIEETHDVGNDAWLDRLAITAVAIWVLASLLLLFLRRLPDGLRAQWRAERGLWREMRAAERDRSSTR